jgi:RNA polymerase sigma factor (TIGR02999 family)
MSSDQPVEMTGESSMDLLPPEIGPQRLYQELKSVATAYLWREDPGHTLQATALVHEALIRLAKDAAAPPADGAAPKKGVARWSSAAEFFRLAAVAMQRILIEHARAKNAVRRGGTGRRAGDSNGRLRAVRVELSEAVGSPTAPSALSPGQLDELQAAMEALAARDPRAAEVVRFRFFAGLTTQEAARVLGVSTATAEADWRIARAWLGRQLGWTAP